jgi:hypothetical protein
LNCHKFFLAAVQAALVRLESLLNLSRAQASLLKAFSNACGSIWPRLRLLVIFPSAVRSQILVAHLISQLSARQAPQSTILALKTKLEGRGICPSSSFALKQCLQSQVMSFLSSEVVL